MAIDAVRRDYNFSDGTLVQESDAMKENVNTDLTDLAAYGVNAATVTAFIALRTAFVLVSSDEYMLSLVIGTTNTKKAARLALENKLRLLHTAVAGKMGNDHQHVTALGIHSLTSLRDADLALTATKARASANNVIADLTGSGVDATFITDLGVLALAFDNSIEAQTVAINNRDNTTRDRINKGNALYKELVRLASFGKDFYDDTNEAKYNNYVIYETSNAAGNTREGNLAASLKVNIDFAEIEGTDTFTITGDTVNDYEVYFGATVSADPVGTPFAVVHSTTYTAQTATALGWEALKPFMIVRNTGGTTVHYKVVKV